VVEPLPLEWTVTAPEHDAPENQYTVTFTRESPDGRVHDVDNVVVSAVGDTDRPVGAGGMDATTPETHDESEEPPVAFHAWTSTAYRSFVVRPVMV